MCGMWMFWNETLTIGNVSNALVYNTIYLNTNFTPTDTANAHLNKVFVIFLSTGKQGFCLRRSRGHFPSKG